MEIYSPAEDSYLLSETIKKYVKDKTITVLEIGIGSGIQLQTLSELGIKKKNIFGGDINKKSVEYCKKLGFNCINSNLFSKISGTFDLIIFNPPYLPANKYDKLPDTTGGKKGDETILRFLKQFKNHLKKDGKCFLLTSSLTPMSRINKILKNSKAKIIAKKKLFQEELVIFLIPS